jgi:L-iditol 2-dehydrogenase
LEIAAAACAPQNANSHGRSEFGSAQWLLTATKGLDASGRLWFVETTWLAIILQGAARPPHSTIRRSSGSVRFMAVGAGVMKAIGLIIDAPGSVGIRELTLPRSEAHDVSIRVELCGICTPEQRVYRGTRRIYPYWGGHELCGIIEHAVAPTNESFNVGDRVAVALMDRCGTCWACRAGFDNHCAYLHPKNAADGVPPGPRGFTTRISVPAYKVFKLENHVPPTAASLVEPLACVLRSVARSRARAGESALVIGCGTMGLIHAAVLTSMGCLAILADRDSTAIDAARARGMITLNLLKDDLATAIPQQLSDNEGVHVAFCTRGGAASVSLAAKLVRRGGRIVLYQSISGDDSISLAANHIHYREIEIIGTIAQTRQDLEQAARFLNSNPSLLDCLSLEVLSFDLGSKVFDRAITPAVNRVLIDFRVDA